MSNFRQLLINAAQSGGWKKTPHNLTSNVSDPRYELSECCYYEEWCELDDGQIQHFFHEAFRAMSGNMETSDAQADYCEEEKAWWQIRFKEGLVKIGSVKYDGLIWESKLSGSYDGVTFHDIAVLPAGSQTCEINTSAAYSYYRITSAANTYNLHEVEFEYCIDRKFISIEDQMFHWMSDTEFVQLLYYGHNIVLSSDDLPAGLTLDSVTGKITGHFESQTQQDFHVTATNTAGETKTVSISIIPYSSESADVTEYEITVTATTGLKYTIPAVVGEVYVLWGDGRETYDPSSSKKSITHAYRETGTYKVTLLGSYSAIALGVWLGFDNHAGLFVTAVTKVTNNLQDSVDVIEPMFGNCKYIKEVPYFDTSSFTCFAHMFLGCSQLKSVPDFDTSCVTNFKQCFDGASLLQNLPQWDYSKSTTFDRAFKNCKAMQGEAAASDFWDNTNITSYRNCFYNCTNLSNYSEIPSSWK